MKKIMLVGLLFIQLNSLKAQQFYAKLISPTKVDELSSMIGMVAKDSSSLYKICLHTDSSDLSLVLYPVKVGSDSDKLQLIGQLLKFEGDERICLLPVKNWNPVSSQLYLGPLKKYSLQVEALFIINQLYFSDPFNYSPYPVLVDRHGNEASIGGSTVSKAYECYKEWYKMLREDGYQNNKDPLRGSSIKWYR